jgi:hypothetical protein
MHGATMPGSMGLKAAGVLGVVCVVASVAPSVAGCGSRDLLPIQLPVQSDADAGAPGAGADAAGGMGAEQEAGEMDAAPVESGAPSGSGDGGTQCKRGVAMNAAPSAVFARGPSVPGLSWWYNWTSQSPGGGDPGIEYVPMIWGRAAVNDALPAGSKYVLGFNEPGFKTQSNLTPQQAATAWPTLQSHARGAGIPTVSPAVNFCGSSSNSSQCSDPTITDPYTYLKDFFAACSGCEVDYVAVHWYGCDVPSLQAYLEGSADGGGSLQGFGQFGRPIWVTEFSCDSSHSVGDQKAYMQAAVPYLEGNPHVVRYSWFSAAPIPNGVLANSDGSLTDLGKTYVALPQSCP